MILHASSVAWQGRGVLILGPSGSGKSTLALRLMALGAVLVADDRTHVAEDLTASAPESLAGLIEARGFGLLRADHAPARLVLAVDLGREEPERLPPMRHSLVQGSQLPLVLGRGRDHLDCMVLQYLKGGRQG